MTRGYINWMLAIVLVVAVSVCVGAGLVLHDWQKSTRADQARPLGMKAYEQEDWAEAAKQLGRYLAVYGDDTEVLLKYGHAQRQIMPLMANNVDQAASAYAAVLRSEKSSPEQIQEATKWSVEICLLKGRYSDAESLMKDFLENNDDPRLRRLLAYALGRQRKFAEASQTLTRLIQDHPDEIHAYDLMGKFSESRPEDFNQPADYWYDRAISENPESALAVILRGHAHLRRNDRAGAEADFKRAESLDLSETTDRLELIQGLVVARLLDQARGHLDAVEAQDPKNEELWRHRAKVALLSQSAEEMQGVAERGLEALAVQPWNFMPWATELLIRTGQYDKAQACILQMQAKDIQRARVQFLQGLLAEQQGRLREAAGFWEKAIALGYQSPADIYWRPESPRVRVALASILSQQGETSRAITVLREHVSENPESVEAYMALARVLATAGDWAGVLEQARQAQRLAPKYIEAAIFELNARIELLQASDDSAATKAQAWRDIENRLSRLEQEEAYATQIKLLKAQVAMAQKNTDQVGVLLDELDRDHPEAVAPILLRAQWCVNEGKTDEALKLLEGAVERFPQNIDAVFRLAGLLNQQGKRETCESLIREAITRSERPQARRLLGLQLSRLYASWGQSQKQYDWLQEMAAQFSEDILVKRSLLGLEPVRKDAALAQKIVDEIKAIEGQDGWQWRLEQVNVWMGSQDFKARYSDAVRLLQENLLRNPQDQDSRASLAKAYELGGERDLSLMTWREALGRSPDDMRIIVGTVTALYRSGKDDEARQILDKAAQRDLDHPYLQALQLEGELKREAWGAASDILQEMLREDPNNIKASLDLAQIYVRQKKMDQAHGILDALLARNPDLLSVVEMKVGLCLNQGDTEKAVRLCNEAVERSAIAPAYMLRGQTYAAINRYEQAFADLGQAITLAPEMAAAWALRSGLYHRQGRLSEAIKDIEKALELAPDNRAIQSGAIELFLRTGDPQRLQQAEAILAQGLKANNSDMGLRILKARILLGQGSALGIEEARVLLEDMAKDPSAPTDVWEMLASLALQQQEASKAVEVASRGLSHYPDSRQLMLLKAQGEAQLQPKLAVPTLRALFDRDPNDIEAIVHLADVYLKSGSNDDALELLRSRQPALSGPARRRCDLMLAMALYRSGAADEAATSFESLITAEPNNPAPVLTWTELLAADQQWDAVTKRVDDWRAKHPEDASIPTAVARIVVDSDTAPARETAEQIVRKTLEPHPSFVPALQMLASLTVTSGRLEESATLNRRILEIDPNDIMAINNLAWFLCEEKGQYQQALDLVDKGIARAPRYIDMIDTRGVIHYRMGHHEAAVRDFGRCIELSTPTTRSLATTRFHLAKAYVELGRKSEAVQQLTRALETRDPRLALLPSDAEEARLLLEQLKK